MKALVTGCCGFIGSNLTDRLLKEGYNVVGIDNFDPYYDKSLKEKNISLALQNMKFRFIEKDLNLMREFPDVDYVFHLAAQAGVRKSWGSYFDVYVKNNISATQRLLEYYVDKKIKRFVYSSSSSVYGNQKMLPIAEDALKKPYSPYGVTKLAAENLCSLYHENYGMPTVSLRYFTVYGPRQRPDMAINMFSEKAIKEEEITVYGTGCQTRDFTYIDDVVEGNVLAAKTECSGEIFNIGGASNISVIDLLKIIGENTNIPKLKFIEEQKGDVDHTMADVNHAQELLGYNPKTNIRDGIKKYIEWKKERLD